jgi:hypothetical protein
MTTDEHTRSWREQHARQILHRLEPAWVWNATDRWTIVIIALAAVVAALRLITAVLTLSVDAFGEAGAAALLAWVLASLRWYQR